MLYVAWSTLLTTLNVTGATDGDAVDLELHAAGRSCDGAGAGVTTAVKVTLCPRATGFGLALTAVLLPAALGLFRIFSFTAVEVLPRKFASPE